MIAGLSNINYFVEIEKAIMKTIKLILIIIFIWQFLSCTPTEPTYHDYTLSGEYSGEYSYITENLSGVKDTFNIDIQFRFTDNKYFLFDTTNTICEYFGDYQLTGQVELIDKTDLCSIGQLDWAGKPVGLFNFRQPSDSIILTQNLDDSINVIKKLKLKIIR